MKNKVFIGFLVIGLGLLLTQFNNCALNSEGDSLFQTLGSGSCEDNSCLESENNLEMRVNTMTDLVIRERSFNVGGDCNEGGFVDNKILWEIYLNNQMIYNWQSGDNDLSGRCNNGRFNVFVRIPNEVTSGQELRLEIEVVGIDSQNLIHKNTLLARKRINMVYSP